MERVCRARTAWRRIMPAEFSIGDKPADLPVQQTKQTRTIHKPKDRSGRWALRSRSPFWAAPTKSSNDAQAPTRPADGPRQYAAARRAPSRDQYEAGEEQALWQAIVSRAGRRIPLWEWLANELLMPWQRQPH